MSDYLICGPSLHVKGSISKRCMNGRCTNMVAIAPSGQRLMVEKSLIPICIPCAKQLVPDAAPARPTREQEVELAEERRNTSRWN